MGQVDRNMTLLFCVSFDLSKPTRMPQAEPRAAFYGEARPLLAVAGSRHFLFVAMSTRSSRQAVQKVPPAVLWTALS
jgi:hypothetical protein